MNFVAYYRVSTQQQGKSGLGIDDQKSSVAAFISGRGVLVGAFEEHETGKGVKALAKRPELRAALDLCKKLDAALVVAKIDRLARNVRFFLEALDDYGVDIRFVEFSEIDPKTDEGRMILTNMATYAEFEGKRIGTRTKNAIKAKRARVEAGTDKSGKTDWSEAWGTAGAANLKPNIEQRQQEADAFAAKLERQLTGFKVAGMTQRAQVDELNTLGIKTARGGAWSLVQLQRVLRRQAEARQAQFDAHPLAGTW